MCMFAYMYIFFGCFVRFSSPVGWLEGEIKWFWNTIPARLYTIYIPARVDE